MIPWHVFIFLYLVYADVHVETTQNPSDRSVTPTETTNVTELTPAPCHLSGSAANYCECSTPGEHEEKDLLMIKCFVDQKYENETILDVYSDTYEHDQGPGSEL